MGLNILEVQQTPNPNALKFVLDRVVADPPISFLSAGAAQVHPLAARLFAIEGVSSLLLLGDFVTVNKTAEVGWTAVQRRVSQVLLEQDWAPHETTASS